MDVEKRPVLAVVSTVFGTDKATLDPGETWDALEDRAYELGMQAYFFDPEAFEYKSLRAPGWWRDRSSGTPTWKQVLCPRPDVVYENVFVHLVHLPAVRQIRRFFVRQGILLFHPNLGHKGKLSEWLRAYPHLWSHHPESILLQDAQDVLVFLQRYSAVYLKPVTGSAGRGVLEIRREGEQCYRLRAAKYGPKKVELNARLTEDDLLVFVGGELDRIDFQLQAGCELLHEQGGKIDIRTHLQRNKQGEWEFIEMVIKRGKTGSIVSNYHAGGSVHEYRWLQDVAQRQDVPLPTQQQLIDLSLQIAAAYTDKDPLINGIGLDLGVDVNGQIWLLDVNCPPGRNILSPSSKVRCQQLNAEFAWYLLQSKK